MPDPDIAKQASDSYKRATDAYVQNQTAQGMAAAKIADKVTEPSLDDLKKKALAGTITPEEQAKLNAASPNPAKPIKVVPKYGFGGVLLNQKELAAADPKWRISPTAMLVDPLGSAPPPSDAEYAQMTDEQKRNIQAGYRPQPITPAQAAAQVPPEVDRYQEQIEAPRVLPGHSMGEPAAPVAATPPVVVTPPDAKKKSGIDKLIDDMKAETSKKDGPNIWDVIQAAAAGWNFQTPAYVERKKAADAKAADIEKLSKTAQFEKELQAERAASELDIEKMREGNALKLAGISGIGTIPTTKGQELGANFVKRIGG